ncbi:MAG TPA: DUF5329 family protein [Xanthomonadaceae bacterium]|jgi:hypothetical protein
MLALLLSLLIAAFANAAPMTERQKIDALIHSIEVLPGAKFIRNGSSYDGKEAADHLRQKLRYAGSRIKTAEQFITYVASGSSMSGEAYQIKLADGRKITSEAFFHTELKRMEAPAPAASTASAASTAPASPAATPPASASSAKR